MLAPSIVGQKPQRDPKYTSGATHSDDSHKQRFNLHRAKPGASTPAHDFERKQPRKNPLFFSCVSYLSIFVVRDEVEFVYIFFWDLERNMDCVWSPEEKQRGTGVMGLDDVQHAVREQVVVVAAAVEWTKPVMALRGEIGVQNLKL